MHGETFDFQILCQHQQWWYKIPDRKINFRSKFTVKLFPATIANADIESLKSLRTFLKKCLYYMPVKFEQNRMVQTTQSFELFEKKRFFKPFWQTLKKRWHHFGRCFSGWNNCLILNYQFIDYNLPVFQKLR